MRIPRLPLILGLVSLALFTVMTSLAIVRNEPASAAYPGGNGKIVFVSARNGNLELYTMNADGTGQTRLTFNTDLDSSPTWSPDGSKIAFDRFDTAALEFHIYVMNGDGSGLVELPGEGVKASWSPDGSKIVFVDGGDIFVMNSDGSGRTPLVSDPAGDGDPTWSPDGTKIAFQSYRDGDWDVYVMNADGTNVTNLTNNSPVTDTQAAWSPDGSQLLFFRAEYVEGVLHSDIHVMNADGSGQTNLTNAPTIYDTSPEWSPDGSKIVFRSNPGGNSDIYVMNPDGSGQTRLTNHPELDFGPDWQPLVGSQPSPTTTRTPTPPPTQGPGQTPTPSPMPAPQSSGKIAFASDRDGNWEVYVMNADGTAPTNLSNNAGTLDADPAWSPDRTKIAFSYVDASDPVNPVFQVRVMNADGSGETPLANDAIAPAWSPDGAEIAFTDGSTIFVMTADGTGKTSLNQPGNDPAWSPDGTKIAFATNRDGNWEVYVANADGTAATNLTSNAGAIDAEPAWSPDGSQIAFRRSVSGNNDIYVMNADGSSQVALADDPAADDGSPAWAPDGSKVAFRSFRAGNGDIYTINPDGSGEVRLTGHPGNDLGPAWQPLAPDDDADGCTNDAELQTAPGSEVTGGRRDPTSFWDFADQYTGSPTARDGTIAVGDVGAVVARFGSQRQAAPTEQEALIEALLPPASTSGYHAASDRAGTAPGGDPWDLLAPDGVIAVGDIGAVVIQFGHNCSGPP